MKMVKTYGTINWSELDKIAEKGAKKYTKDVMDVYERYEKNVKVITLLEILHKAFPDKLWNYRDIEILRKRKNRKKI